MDIGPKGTSHHQLLRLAERYQQIGISVNLGKMLAPEFPT
jgi:hypothetical protein